MGIAADAQVCMERKVPVDLLKGKGHGARNLIQRPYPRF